MVHLANPTVLVVYTKAYLHKLNDRISPAEICIRCRPITPKFTCLTRLLAKTTMRCLGAGGSTAIKGPIAINIASYLCMQWARQVLAETSVEQTRHVHTGVD